MPGPTRRHRGRLRVDAHKVDAVVIGAGAGGLCAAARLAHGGLHTLVVDDKDRLGGRAST
ncbi:NAD(P)-binding protein, partial [Enterobacter hormaechei]